MPFICSICGEQSTRICARCTKDACDNHLCEKCLRCSDCCECEVTLSEPSRHVVRVAIAEPEPVPEPPLEEPAPAAEEPLTEPAPAAEAPLTEAPLTEPALTEPAAALERKPEPEPLPE
jgi:hypothetical protein